MHSIEKFINRNKDYQKVADVPQELINKYKGIVPEELIYIWKKLGFGIYEQGFLQLINPEEYQFIFEYVDTLLEPTIPWGITALGDILCWEGKENRRSIPIRGGNRCFRIDVRRCNDVVISNMSGILNNFIGEEYFLVKKNYFDAKPYLDVKDKLPKLEYGQCYGYVPALALGGKKSNKNLQIVDAIKQMYDVPPIENVPEGLKMNVEL